MSPYPTVVMVTIAQYTLLGMLVNPLASPSMRCIIAPITRTTISTTERKTVIFCPLERMARFSTSASRR